MHVSIDYCYANIRSWLVEINSWWRLFSRAQQDDVIQGNPPIDNWAVQPWRCTQSTYFENGFLLHMQVVWFLCDVCELD